MNKNISPVIEIHGTGIHNRGAELMAIAISEKIKLEYPHAQIVVPATFGFPSDLKRYNFISTTEFQSRSKRSIFTFLISLISGKIVTPKKVDSVIDASGFAFSDQWGEGAAKELFEKMMKKNRISQRLILLPQALGSFNDPSVKQWTEKVFNRASIVFARDKQSFNYAFSLLKNDKLYLSPDFTISLKPCEKNINLPNNYVAIVPNFRMLDKSDKPEEYLNFIRKSVDLIVSNNLTPLFIVHDAHEDSKVVGLLGDMYKSYPIFQDSDPRVLKWVLGKSEFVIGSRFHALVSALSQGVPCIGAGWSHKYPELFADFSNREGLIDDLGDLELLTRQITQLSHSEYRAGKSQEISKAANNLKMKVDKMWDMVFKQINIHFNIK